jgi:hypothetical protein
MSRLARAFTIDTSVHVQLDQLTLRSPEDPELRLLFQVTQSENAAQTLDAFGLYACDYDLLYDLINVPKHARVAGPENYKRLMSRYYAKPTDAITAQLNAHIRRRVGINKTKTHRITNASRVVEALLILGLKTLNTSYLGAGKQRDFGKESKGHRIRKNRNDGEVAGEQHNIDAHEASQTNTDHGATSSAA